MNFLIYLAKYRKMNQNSDIQTTENLIIECSFLFTRVLYFENTICGRNSEQLPRLSQNFIHCEH